MDSRQPLESERAETPVQEKELENAGLREQIVKAKQARGKGKKEKETRGCGGGDLKRGGARGRVVGYLTGPKSRRRRRDPRKLDNFDVTSAKQLSRSTSPDVAENQLSGPKVQPAGPTS